MKHRAIVWVVGLLVGLAGSAMHGADDKADKEALTRKLWPRERITAALAAVEKQHREGLLSDTSYARRMEMLEKRLAGTYQPQALSVTDPPLNFVQNAGFEEVNRNSARNRSRWMWWSGWDWGGDYENSWEDRPGYVHGGKLSARIRCTGKTGRIGIFTPSLPAVPGATQYTLTFWARGEGENQLFVNFESGARGALREKILDRWQQYTVVGTPQPDADTYGVYFYATGAGTIWLDDVRLVPVGGKLDE